MIRSLSVYTVYYVQRKLHLSLVNVIKVTSVVGLYFSTISNLMTYYIRFLRDFFIMKGKCTLTFTKVMSSIS